MITGLKFGFDPWTVDSMDRRLRGCTHGFPVKKNNRSLTLVMPGPVELWEPTAGMLLLGIQDRVPARAAVRSVCLHEVGAGDRNVPLVVMVVMRVVVVKGRGVHHRHDRYREIHLPISLINCTFELQVVVSLILWGHDVEQVFWI